MAILATLPSVSVVIACHTDKREKLLARAVHSVLEQRPKALEVIVVVDHNPSLLENLQARLSGGLPGASEDPAPSDAPRVVVLPNRSRRGASGARNTGAAAAGGELVAFLDDDAAARPGWLAALVAALAHPGVIGAGGLVKADWASGQPGWFPGEFGWVVGATYDGAPTRLRPVRNGWAENMIVRRADFEAVDGFRAGFGKLGAHSRPEDTDLCIRMQTAGGRWLFQPAAVVTHHVPAERATTGFFLRRCWHEGRGKAELARLLPDPRAAHTEEGTYLRRVLPRGLARHLGRFLRTGRAHHLARATMLVAGLGATIAGYGWQRVVDRRSPAARPVAGLENGRENGREIELEDGLEDGLDDGLATAS